MSLRKSTEAQTWTFSTFSKCRGVLEDDWTSVQVDLIWSSCSHRWHCSCKSLLRSVTFPLHDAVFHEYDCSADPVLSCSPLFTYPFHQGSISHAMSTPIAQYELCKAPEIPIEPPMSHTRDAPQSNAPPRPFILAIVGYPLIHLQPCCPRARTKASFLFVNSHIQISPIRSQARIPHNGGRCRIHTRLPYHTTIILSKLPAQLPSCTPPALPGILVSCLISARSI